MSFDKVNKPWYANVNKSYRESIQHVGGSPSIAGAFASLTNAILIATAGSLGSKVKNFFCSTQESVDRDYFVFKVNTDGVTIYPIGIVSIPATSGTVSGIPAVDILAQLVGLSADNQSKPVLEMEASEKLYISCLTTMTDDLPAYFTALLKDYEAES